jgi:nucleoside phosphorylase
LKERQNSSGARIVVICALEFEAAHLRGMLAGAEWPVEVVVCGTGMANAAAAAEEVIARTSPRAVLNYGCAGAHRADLQIGDIVVGTRVIAYLTEDTPAIECDAEFLALARSVAREDVHFGTVASADAWNRDGLTIAQLATRHESLCEDMEAAAIALVCAKHNVRFGTVKDISNNELVRGTLSAEHMFTELGRDQIAKRAAAFTFELLTQAYLPPE